MTHDGRTSAPRPRDTGVTKGRRDRQGWERCPEWVIDAVISDCAFRLYSLLLPSRT
jgi:hypothetical protein